MDLDLAACYRAFETKDARFDGRIFIGVHTTGIYCRPVCPARTPLRDNVSFYVSAAAAQENGFRPCLRCRPETAPDLGVWNGTSNTVSRALQLIDLGALDEGDVETLAGRLGVGGRHLRRLFKTHLGATPISVAQSRRVHLAKQLLHETDLTMTEIAMASGFGSIRRFNECFQQLFNRPPGEIRRSRAQERDPAATGVTVRLRFKPPLDWPALLGFFAQRAVPGVEVIRGEAYHRVIRIGDAMGRVSISPNSETDLHAHIEFPDLTLLPQIIARLRRVLDLGADMDRIARDLGEDVMLKPLLEARPGLRCPGAFDVFEMAVRAVLGQQISVAGAATIAGRLTRRLGRSLENGGDEDLAFAFPTAEEIASGDLSDLGVPGARAQLLKRLAELFMEDPDLLAPGRDLEEAVARLCSISGVGPWTAHYIALRAMREPDAFPASDVALLKAWERLSGVRPSAAELEARAEVWRPWRGYAAQHLWASLVD